MTEEERYLFDLQGYLVVEDALGPEEVAELNRKPDDDLTPELRRLLEPPYAWERPDSIPPTQPR